MKEKQAKTRLWQRGNLSFLLDDNQRSLLDAFEKSDSRKFIWLCSRRIGKTHGTVVTAFQYAIRNPGSKVIYITSSFKNAKEIIQPIVNDLLETCPLSVRPQYKTQDSKYVFPNGSQVCLYGTDRNTNVLRGQQADDLIILDECAFMNNLAPLVDSVLNPMCMLTGARILMATTPPESPDHDFTKYLEEATAAGAIEVRTIYDCPRLTPKQIEEEKQTVGGEDSAAWQREYLCRTVRDADITVIPEFTEEKAKEIVQETPRPSLFGYYDKYVGFDPGFSDNSAAVFGYWDFANSRLVIEDELLASRQNTEQVAQAIRQKETSLWGHSKPYRRGCDSADPRIISDLTTTHGISFVPVDKPSKEFQVGQIRQLIHSGQLVIHPRCTNLVSQLMYCRWQKNSRSSFARTSAYGHFDLVDALIYLVLSLSRGRNPIPQGIGISQDTHFIPPDFYENQPQQQLAKALIPQRFRSKFTRRR